MVDKLDAKIFGKENYQPLAGQGFVAALKTAVGVGIVLFLVQMFTTGRTLENWTAGIGAACILIAMVMKTLPNFLGANVEYWGEDRLWLLLLFPGFFCLATCHVYCDAAVDYSCAVHSVFLYGRKYW